MTTTTLTLPDAIALGAKHGDYWCLNELTTLHRPFLHSLARKYRSSAQSFEYEDLLQESVLAMCELLKYWDPGKGTSFFTYLYSWGGMKVRRAMDYCDAIVYRPNRVASIERKKYSDTGHSDMPFSLPLFIEGLEDGQPTDVFFNDLVADALTSQSPESAVYVNEVLNLIAQWPPMEREAFSLMLQGHSMTEIAEQLGCSVNAIRAGYYERLRELRESLKE